MNSNELTNYICMRIRQFDTPLDEEFWIKYREWEKIFCTRTSFT